MSHGLFGIGRSSLMVSKKSLETTGHNIANAGTDGYSRQIVEHEARPSVAFGGARIGRGVDVKQVRRVHDKFLEKRISRSQSENAYFSTLSGKLNELQEIFNEVDGKGMSKLMNEFFNSFRDLANQPENQIMREVVRDKAQLVSRDFRSINDKINTLIQGIDDEIRGAADHINTLLQEIAQLNVKISQFEISSPEVSANDLRDKRDLAVNKLSDYFALSVHEDEMNRFVVNADGVGSLVSGNQSLEIEAGIMRESDDPSDPGTMHIFYKDKPILQVTDRLLVDGKLKGMVDARNKDLMGMKRKLDFLAYDFTKAINAVHRRGYINMPLPVDERGIAFDDGTYKQVTGINLFKEPLTELNASANIDLSELVKESSDYIAAAYAPNAPGDNRIALAITKLSHEKVADMGSETFEESYLKLVSKSGLRAGKMTNSSEHSKGILAQLKTMKSRMSGVSLDEEAANLVKYQHLYQSSAKVIQESEKAFDSILGIMDRR